ncbi:MAG: RNA polymerase sigma factor [Actinomycetota bacterium]
MMDALGDGEVSAYRLARRDSAATAEEIFRKHHRDITRYISSRFHADIADDVASAVYLKILEGRFQGPGLPTWPWLRVVATNAAIDLLRASKSDRQEALTVDLADHGDTEGQLTSRIDLDRALKDLRRVERDAVLALPSGYRPSDVADHHGRTVSAIHSITKRTKARLRVMLEVTTGAAALLGARVRRWFGFGPPPGAEALLHAAAVVALVMVPSTTIAHADVFPTQPQTGKVVPSIESVGRIAVWSAGGRLEMSVLPDAGSPAALQVNSTPGATIPRKIVFQEPTFDTPLGPVGGGRTEADCVSRGYETLGNWLDDAGLC